MPRGLHYWFASVVFRISFENDFIDVLSTFLSNIQKLLFFLSRDSMRSPLRTYVQRYTVRDYGR